MPVSLNNFIWMVCFALLLIAVSPVFPQMSMSERSLPRDTVIEDTYQGGSGLPVGKIQSVRGEIYIFHRDPAVGYRAKTGLPLYQGDVLQTRENSRILCRLVDGSKLTMAPGTRLTLLQSNLNSAGKSSVSFLSLNRGGARFYANPGPESANFQFKVQTETAYVQTQVADFVVKAGPGVTEIAALENSRLEVTSLAGPEEVHYLSDYQRAVVRPDSVAPVVETVSPIEAEVLMAEFRLVPENKSHASGSTNRRSRDITEETLKD